MGVEMKLTDSSDPTREEALLAVSANPTAAAVAAMQAGKYKEAVIAAKPGGIEQSEREGQFNLVNSTNFPKEINGTTREELEARGFKFGEDVDDLFVSAELPAGWRKESSSHQMHSYLVDDQDMERGIIFYKAAFYDRRADLHWYKEPKPYEAR
jgi:hypothetical protein